MPDSVVVLTAWHILIVVAAAAALPQGFFDSLFDWTVWATFACCDQPEVQLMVGPEGLTWWVWSLFAR